MDERRENARNIIIFWNTGYDVKTLLEKEVFAVLGEIEYFMQTCTIMNDTLAWDISENRDSTKCIDIDPDTLYTLNAVKEKIA